MNHEPITFTRLRTFVWNFQPEKIENKTIRTEWIWAGNDEYFVNNQIKIWMTKNFVSIYPSSFDVKCSSDCCWLSNISYICNREKVWVNFVVFGDQHLLFSGLCFARYICGEGMNNQLLVGWICCDGLSIYVLHVFVCI